MIKLRTLPFFAIGVVFILFGSLVFSGAVSYAWYAFALLYIILGFSFRNDGANSQSHGHH